MAFVRQILVAYAGYGVDPGDALRRAGIPRAHVRRTAARIDAGQFETISSAAMQELDDEALGWFSRRLPWGSYGMLCRASAAAPTLGVALKRWCRHHRLLTPDVDLRLELDRTAARLVIHEVRAPGPTRELCLLALLRYVHGYACWLVNSELPLREVTFPFAAPPHASVYPFLFPGPVRFGAAPGMASMAFDPQYLELSPKRDERALGAMLQRALPLTVRQYRRDRLLVNRVREHLGQARGAVTAADVAAALHVSVRSLHRQLAAEDASLQQIKDDVHRARALELLRGSTLLIKQIATSVGFANEKSFARAFRAWTGESPTEHRRRMAAPA